MKTDGMNIEEMKVLLQKCNIGFRKNLSAGKIRSIFEDNIEVITAKVEEEKNIEKSKEIETSKKKTEKKTKKKEELSSAEIDEHIQRCQIRQNALLKKSEECEQEMKELRGLKADEKVLTLHEMLVISRREAKNEPSKTAGLTSAEKRAYNIKLERKRNNAIELNRTVVKE